MILDLENLPSDTVLLQQIIRDLVQTNEVLKEQLTLLKARRFGKSSEKLDSQIEEIEQRLEENESFSPFIEEEDVGVSDTADTQDHHPVKKKAKRQPLPEHLPREEVTLPPPASCPECGGDKFRKISDDITEILEYIPSSFKVIRTVRPRCACVACEKITQASPPDYPITKGKAGPGLLAHMIVQKYMDHLPLYRQSEIWAREHIELSRSTMAGWVGQCTGILEPLIQKLRSDVLASHPIHGDDTPVRVLAPGLGKTRTGRLWVYVRDGRPHGDATPPAACYFYSPDRKEMHPLDHLKEFKGILHADAYSGFNKLYHTKEGEKKEIDEAACWAHTRRKFYEMVVVSPNATIAGEALKRIGKLYELEDQVRGSPPEKRLEHREKYSAPIVNDFFTWIKQCRSKVPNKSSTATAITYALNQETALRHFLVDGRVEIDNNAAERALRTVALGRKNWLFAGSDAGGQSAAAMLSLLQTAKLNHINPQLYLSKVLSLIQGYNSQKLADLLPWNLNIE